MDKFNLLRATLTTLALLLAPTTSILGADFQVSTEIYVGPEAKEPSARNTTMFRGDIVYDFSPDSNEITIFNTESGRFILLDQQRRLKTELSTRELLAYAQWMRTETKRESKDKLLLFCCSPEFALEQSEANSTWQFKSDVLTYRVKYSEASEADVALRYRTFCDWFARLNALTNPGSLPPFARMEVNAKLDQHGAIPQTIHLNIAPHPRFGKREFLVRSEHTFRPGLTSSAVSQIEVAERHLVTFKAVSIDNYRDNRLAQSKQD